MFNVGYLNTGQSLYGLNLVAVQLEMSEEGEVDVSHLLQYCRPFIVIYIIHHLLKRSFFAGH